MIRNLKALGLALVAVFAMSAMAASAAQAVTPTLVTGGAGTVEGDQVTGTVHEFTVGARAVNCKKAHFKGNSLASQTTLTITPEYSECGTTPVLGVSLFATVTMNGCDYLFTNLSHNAAAGDYNSDVSIICPGTSKIEVHIYSNSGEGSEICTLTIESDQTDLSGNTITNVAGSPNDLLIHHNVKVKTENHGNQTICGAATSEAEYHGTTTLKAFIGANQTTLTAITDA